MTTSNTTTQGAFTTTTTTTTHRMAANDCFVSFHQPATQEPTGHSAPMLSKQYSSSAAARDMTMSPNVMSADATTQYREPFQNVSSRHQNSVFSTATTTAFVPRPPPLPAGQTRLRFVDCLAWMVNSLTEGHDHHQMDVENDKPMVWWSPDGQALYFRLDKEYEEQLSAVIRPFFKHGNFGSIRRQLFAYGFSKPLQGPNKKGFTHPHFKRGELTPENLKLIIRKVKGKQSAAAKLLQQEEETGYQHEVEDQENATNTWDDEHSDNNANRMIFKPTMKQQAQQLVKDLNSASSSSIVTKQTKKVTHRVSLDQHMTAEDMAAVAELKSLRAVPHQSIIDGNYQVNKENNISPRIPLPDYRQEEKSDPLQPAPYVLYPSESGTGSVVKVTRDWYVQTIQNKAAANHCNVLVI